MALDTADVGVDDAVHRGRVKAGEYVAVAFGRVVNDGRADGVYSLASREFLGGRQGEAVDGAVDEGPLAHGQALVRPGVSEQLDYEGEIALVIGRAGRHIPRERALEHVAGVTLLNEGTVRDWLRHGKFNVTQGKNFDASGSIGPWMESDVDLTKPLHLTVKVNGEVERLKLEVVVNEDGFTLTATPID